MSCGSHQDTNVESLLLGQIPWDLQNTVQCCLYEAILLTCFSAAPLWEVTEKEREDVRLILHSYLNIYTISVHFTFKMQYLVSTINSLCHMQCLTVIVCEVEQNSDNGSHTVLHGLAHVAMTTLREGGAWWRDLSAVTLYHLFTMLQGPSHTQKNNPRMTNVMSHKATTLSLSSHTLLRTLWAGTPCRRSDKPGSQGYGL